jgi:hypothetical protein
VTTLATFSKRMLVVLAALLASACGGAGSGGGSQGAGDFYYHWACNGDSECLQTNPTGQASGTVDEGPVEVNCTQLQQFRIHFWGPASWDACDHSPTFTLPGSGTPSVTLVSPTAGTPGTAVTITGTNFPTSASDVTLELGGLTLTTANAAASTSGNTSITFGVPNAPMVRGPITVHTPGGQATSSSAFTILDDLTGVAWSGTSFVAVGAYGTALTSPDGLAWTPRTTGVNPLVVSLASAWWSGTGFLAGGTNGTILSSPDGVTWTSLSSGLGMSTVHGFASSGTQLIAVGTASALAKSTDGSTWTAGSYGQASDAYNGVVWGNGEFVAVGYQILTSPDATTWTQRVAPSTAHTGVAWNGSTFVAVGNGGVVRTSPDGVTWTTRTSGTSANLRAVTWTNGHFVAVGAAGTVLTSADGSSWTARLGGGSVTLNGVAASGSRVVAVGNAGVTISSSDGTDWTSSLPPAPTGVSGLPGVSPTVSWSPVAGATSYVVYASGSSAVSKTSYSKRVVTSATSAQVTGINVDGYWWYFVVTAVNAYGEGPPSAPSLALCVGTHICG